MYKKIIMFAAVIFLAWQVPPVLVKLIYGTKMPWNVVMAPTISLLAYVFAVGLFYGTFWCLLKIMDKRD